MARERLLPPDYMSRVSRSMEAMAREVGLTMVPKDRLINSRLALATAEFARERDAFDRIHAALFKSHWEGTAELDRVADLRRIVAEHGLDPDVIEEALSSGRYDPAIDGHRADATAVGIDAIPAHVVEGRYLLIGAQPVSAFEQVLDRMAAEGAAAVAACPHVHAPMAAPRAGACEGCGSTFNLRACATCGYVGCCESQQGHNTRHARESGHEVIRSLPLDPSHFTWCYACDTYLG